MQHVKNEYELCAKRYQNTISSIANPPGNKTHSNDANTVRDEQSPQQHKRAAKKGINDVCW